MGVEGEKDGEEKGDNTDIEGEKDVESMAMRGKGQEQTWSLI